LDLADIPGVDLQTAFTRLGKDRDRISRFLRGFVRDFRSGPEQIERDLAAGDVKALGAFGHMVKSSAAYIGAHQLAEAAEQVENAQKQDQLGEIAALVSAFRRELQTVLQGIITYTNLEG